MPTIWPERDRALPLTFPTLIWGAVKGKRSKVSRRRVATPTRPPQNPNPTPSLQDLAAAGPSRGQPSGMTLMDRFDQVADDVRREATGRNRKVRNITHTNTITTVYEEDPNGTPTVRRTSSRSGPGRRNQNRHSSQSGSGFWGGFGKFMKQNAKHAWDNRDALKKVRDDHRALYKKAGLRSIF